jgi:hypothetical protein
MERTEFIWLTQDKGHWWVLITSVINRRVPYGPRNLTSKETFCFSRTLFHDVRKFPQSS